MDKDTVTNYRTGRETKLTPKRKAAFLEYIELGLSSKRACSLIGIDISTLHNWLDRGKRGDGKRYVDFFLDFEKSREQFVLNNLKLIKAAAKGEHTQREIKTVTQPNGKQIVTKTNKTMAPQWTAAAWMLERICPEDFSKHHIIEDETSTNIAESIDSIINGN